MTALCCIGERNIAAEEHLTIHLIIKIYSNIYLCGILSRSEAKSKVTQIEVGCVGKWETNGLHEVKISTTSAPW